MELTIQNLPFLYLIWITLGIVLILIGIFMLVAHVNTISSKEQVPLTQQETENLEGILSYFLQEEEKKNQGFREMLEGYTKEIGNKVNKANKTETKSDQNVQQNVNEITLLADQGLDEEEIARKLGKGVGEVRLILSLYKMR